MAEVLGPEAEATMSCFYSGDYSGSYASVRRPKLIVTYQPDTTSPSTSITQPAKNSILSGNVTIKANATDSYGIDRVEFYANSAAGESLLGTDTTAPYQANWDTRLYPNGSYILRVKAYDNAGNMGTGTDLNYTVTVNNVLTPPTGLTAQITSGHEVQLHWNSLGISGVTYRVYRSTSSGLVPAPDKLIAGGLSDPDYLDQTPLGNGVTYYYCVTAVSADGTVVTGASNKASIIYSTQMQSPLALYAWSYGNTGISLSWNKPPTAANSYVIYRGTASGFTLTSDKIIATITNGSTTTYLNLLNTNLLGTTYYYRIIAKDASGSPSEPSNEASATFGDAVDNSLTRRGIRPFYTYIEFPLPRGELLVNMGAGNLVLTSTDSLLTGNKLVSAVRRTYNSTDKSCEGISCYGWQANVNQSLYIQGNDLVFAHGDGYREVYIYDSLTGQYQSPAGSYLTVTRNQADSTYTITSKENIIYIFDSQGRLTSIKDLNDNEITYTYGNNEVVITDTVGRSTRLGLNSYGQITEIDDPRNNSTLYGYDSTFHLTSVTDPMGYITRYYYDQYHNLTKIVTPTGTTYNLVYDSRGHIASMSDGLGNTTEFSFDFVNGESQVIDPLGNLTTFNFNPETGLVTGATDAKNQTTTNTYDAKYNLTQTVDPRGVTTNYDYDLMGNMTDKSITYANNSVIYHAAYNNLNLPTSLTRPYASNNPNNIITRYFYDNKGNLTSTLDTIDVPNALYNRIDYAYDVFGRRTSETLPYACNQNGVKLNAGDPKVKNLYTYNAYGNLASLTNANNIFSNPANNKSQTFTYNNMGLLASSTDELLNTTYYVYDDLGRLVTTTYPDNKSIQNLVDGDDRLVRTIDQKGACTNFGYDAAGRIIQITNPMGGSTTYEYDAAGNRISEEDPTGVKISNGYDQLNYLQTVADELGNTYIFDYDACGNMTEIIHPSGHSEFAAYDFLNRKISSGRDDVDANTPNPTTYYSYDLMGNLIEIVDPKGNETHYEYYSNGWLNTVTDALNNTTHYTYDPCGNRLSVTDAKNNTTTYTYNNIGKVLIETLPDNTKTTWTYDYLGRIATRKDGMNHLTSYVYDNLGRVTNKNYSLNGYPAGPYTSSTLPTASYTYDSAGNRTSMTDNTGTTTYQYDPNGNLTSVTDGYGKQVQYTYDQANRRTSLITSFGSVDYTYDIAGNLSSINDFMENEITLNRDSEGRINQIIYPRINNQNGTAQYTFNGLDQLTGIDFTVPNGKYNRASYGYDNNGNCIEIEQFIKDYRQDAYTYNYNYQYDALNRQIGQQTTKSSSSKYGNCTYGYDEVGNRTSFSYEGELVVPVTVGMTSAGTSSYDIANRLISRNYLVGSTPHTETLEYDNNGNQGKILHVWWFNSGDTYDTEEIRQYDLENRLTRTKTKDTRGIWYQTDYFYNGDGQLIKTITGCLLNDELETSYFLNDGNTIIAELDGAGAVIDSYTRIPGNGNLISAYRQIDYNSVFTNDRGTVYTCSDLMGNIMLIFAKDIDEVKANCFDYYGFGGSSQGGLGRFGFTGAPSFDGLYKMGARYYNPEIGRFITRDTYKGEIYKPWTQNLYTYCNNNPVNYVDPTGHVALELREVVKEHRGTVSWDEDTKTATATIGNITKSYKIDDCVVKDDHIMLQSSQIARDFGLNQTVGVEGRHTLAQTGAYLKSDEAKTAYKQTGIAAATCTGAGAIVPEIAGVQIAGGLIYAGANRDWQSSVVTATNPSTWTTIHYLLTRK